MLHTVEVLTFWISSIICLFIFGEVCRALQKRCQVSVFVLMIFFSCNSCVVWNFQSTYNLEWNRIRGKTRGSRRALARQAPWRCGFGRGLHWALAQSSGTGAPRRGAPCGGATGETQNAGDQGSTTSGKGSRGRPDQGVAKVLLVFFFLRTFCKQNLMDWKIQTWLNIDERLFVGIFFCKTLRNNMDKAIDFRSIGLHHLSFHSGTFTFGCTSETVSVLKSQLSYLSTVTWSVSNVHLWFVYEVKGFFWYTWEIHHVGWLISLTIHKLVIPCPHGFHVTTKPKLSIEPY